MVILFGYIIILFMAGCIIVGSQQIRAVERENHIMQSYILSMQEFYKVMQEQIEATRCYRHDLAKHIQMLEIILEQQKDENQAEIREYRDDLQRKQQMLLSQRICQDDIVNAILLIKKQQCREKDIPLELQIQNTKYSGLEDADMTGLLYNLMDNAIEANERIREGGKRGIQLSMGKEDNKIFVRVQNQMPIGEKITFKTNKKAQEKHGLGMKIIHQTVEKYKGTYEIRYDKKVGIMYMELSFALNQNPDNEM
ncbi:MAG: GHKL domain-containing protein [Hespellia sp.]|nr:GHKL domain-containing protein [Hespellia sp.]